MTRSLLLWLALASCAPTVDGLCEDLAEECSPGKESKLDTQQCIQDGDELESRADDKDCNDAFDRYLDCVDEQRCAWDTECTKSRADFERCANTSMK